MLDTGQSLAHAVTKPGERSNNFKCSSILTVVIMLDYDRRTVRLAAECKAGYVMLLH